MSEFDLVKQCLLNCMSVNFGKLTICDLYQSSSYRGKRRYQVYCEDSKNRFADNYWNLDEAVNKFLEIKPKVKAYVY